MYIAGILKGIISVCLLHRPSNQYPFLSNMCLKFSIRIKFT